MNKNIMNLILILSPLILLIVLGYVVPIEIFPSLESIRDYVRSFGILAPIIFVGINILQVIVTPISHYFIGIAGGFIFGTVFGFIYNYIGRVIGSILAFYIARKIGFPIIRKFIKNETINKFTSLMERGSFIIFIMYALPFFPDDEVSYLLGLSKISFFVYLVIILLGHIPGAFFSAATGSLIAGKEFLLIAIGIVVSAPALIILWFYRSKIEKLIQKYSI